LNRLDGKKKRSGSAQAYVKIADKKGKVGNSILVDAYHGYSVVNETNKKQVYEQQFGILCGDMHNFFVEHIEVEAHGAYEGAMRTYGIVQRETPVIYSIEGETSLKGESTSYAKGYAYLYITKK
jgi:hypothetical protein